MPQTATALSIPECRYHWLREIFFDFEFSLVSCVFWKNRAPWHLPLRSCPDSFLLFPLRGELALRLNGNTHSVPPGRFLMLPEDTTHSISLKPSFRHLEQVSVHCHIHNRWGQPLLSRLASPIGRVNLPEASARLKELAALMSRDRAVGKLSGETFLKDLLAAQVRQGAELEPAPDGDPRVVLALERMARELSSPELSVESLARDLDLSPVQLRKLFRRSTGAGPKEILSRLRFRKASGLLRHSTDPVKKIAADCGFASDHYFHLAFRKEYGCTPSGYRRKSSEGV